ncbi:MAG: hypothetical protein U9Q63_03515 [Patescibacteria group bacterium]|nr:hypothetical protein [Patescibacteria group bacterium]
MQNTQPIQNPTQPTPTSQSANTPPTTQAPLEETPKKKKTWLLIFLVVLLLSATGVLGYKYYELKQQLENKQSAPLPSPELKEKSTASPNKQLKESEIISIDDIWNKYINYQHGFSIYIPKISMNGYGACEWNDKDGDHSYRPKDAHVPIQVLEDNSSVYIVSEYYYQLAGKTKETVGLGTRSYYSECNKTPVTLSLLADTHYLMFWEIVTKDVKDDYDLEQFIKDEYGAGCKLGEKKASPQDNVFNILIDKGEFIDLKEAIKRNCLVNYMYEIKYSPELNKAVSYKRGQDASYRSSLNKTFDDEMDKSFQFLTENLR